MPKYGEMTMHLSCQIAMPDTLSTLIPAFKQEQTLSCTLLHHLQLVTVPFQYLEVLAPSFRL